MGSKSAIDWDAPALKRKRIVRAFWDVFLRALVWLGGLLVLAAISLMMLYLGYIVWPLFQPARLILAEKQSPPWLKSAAPALLLSLEEQHQLALRIDKNGEALFFALADGSERLRERLPLPEGVTISTLARTLPEQDLSALGLSDGTALLFAPHYQTSFQTSGKNVQPQLSATL